MKIILYPHSSEHTAVHICPNTRSATYRLTLLACSNLMLSTHMAHTCVYPWLWGSPGYSFCAGSTQTHWLKLLTELRVCHGYFRHLSMPIRCMCILILIKQFLYAAMSLAYPRTSEEDQVATYNHQADSSLYVGPDV